MDGFREFGEGTEFDELQKNKPINEMNEAEAEVLGDTMLDRLKLVSDYDNPAYRQIRDEIEGEADRENQEALAETPVYEAQEIYNDHGVKITTYTQKGDGEEIKREAPVEYTLDGYRETAPDGTVLQHPARLDVTKIDERVSDNIVGTPVESLEYWHKQETPTSCSVACQDFIIDEMTEHSPSEAELRQIGRELGYYSDELGTFNIYVGKTVEEYGLQHESVDGLTIENLQESLERGDKIIGSVDSRLLYYPDSQDYVFADFLKRGNHSVQITGLDFNDPSDVKIIVNDPLLENGGANIYSWDDFKKCSDDEFVRIFR